MSDKIRIFAYDLDTDKYVKVTLRNKVADLTDTTKEYPAYIHRIGNRSTISGRVRATEFGDYEFMTNSARLFGKE